MFRTAKAALRGSRHNDSVPREPNREIERKFLVPELPTDIDEHPSTRVAQGYLAVDGKDELRIRERSNGDFTLTLKQGSGMSRAEQEVQLTEGLFRQLWPGTEGRRVFKDRHEVPLAGRQNKIELDVYREQLAGLSVAEIEFDSEEEAATFEPPPWFGREVTDNSGYKNRALAERANLDGLDLS